MIRGELASAGRPRKHANGLMSTMSTGEKGRKEYVADRRQALVRQRSIGSL